MFYFLWDIISQMLDYSQENKPPEPIWKKPDAYKSINASAFTVPQSKGK